MTRDADRRKTRRICLRKRGTAMMSLKKKSQQARPMAWKASSFMSTMAPSAGLAASMDGYHAASLPVCRTGP